MSFISRIVMALVAVCVLLYIMRKIGKKRLQVHYAIYWTIFTVLIVFFCIFPNVINYFANIFNVQVSVHLFLIGFSFLLLIKLFDDTVRISALERKIENLTQNIAVKNKLDEEKEGK